MKLAYDPKSNFAVLFATPDEMRELANQLQERVKTAIPGDSLSVMSLNGIHGWTGEPTELVLNIAAAKED